MGRGLEENVTESAAAGRNSRSVTKLGRPRDPAVHEAILRATGELLGELGYARLSIDGVAQRAGVTRQSIYRRWQTKLELVEELIRQVSRSAPVADTGSLRGDLIALHRLYARDLSTRSGPVIPALVAESLHNVELTRVLDIYLSKRRRREIEIFDRAAARGEIVPVANPDFVLDLIAGYFWFRKLIRRTRIRDDEAESFADFLIAAILR